MSDKALADFKTALHENMQDAAMELLPLYFKMLAFTDDPEVMRKGLVFMVQTVGAEAEKKNDPYANLPMVNITFTNGTVSSASALPTIDVVATQLANLTPTPAMQRNSYINADLDLDFGADL